MLTNKKQTERVLHTYHSLYKILSEAKFYYEIMSATGQTDTE